MKELTACTSDELKLIRDRADDLISSKIDEERREALRKLKSNKQISDQIEQLKKEKKTLSKKVRFCISVPFLVEFEPFDDGYDLSDLSGTMTLKVVPNSKLTRNQVIALNSLINEQEVYADDTEINLLPTEYLKKFSQFENKCDKLSRELGIDLVEINLL